MTLDCKIILGREPWLSMAIEDWSLMASSCHLIPVELAFNKDYSFIFPDVSMYDISRTTSFVAWGPDFLNFQRYEIFGELKKLGYKMPPLINPTSTVSNSFKIQENSWVQAHCKIGPNVTIGLNSIISNASIIAPHCQIGNNSFVGEAVRLKDNVSIGNNVYIGDALTIESFVKVGSKCYLEFPDRILNDVPMNSFAMLKSNLFGTIMSMS